MSSTAVYFCRWLQTSTFLRPQLQELDIYPLNRHMEFSDDLQMMHSVQIYRCIRLQRLSHAVHLSLWNTDLCVWWGKTVDNHLGICQCKQMWFHYFSVWLLVLLGAFVMTRKQPKGLREIILHLSIYFSAAFQHLYCLTGFAVNVLARMSALSSSSSPAVADLANRFGRLKLCPFEAAVVTKAPSDMWVVKQQFDQTALQSQFT